MKRKLFVLFPVIFLLFGCMYCMASQTKETVRISINGSESDIRVLNHDYENNMYISMNDMSVLLKDTDRAFTVEWTTKDGQTCVVLKPGKTEKDALQEKTDEIDTDAQDDEKVNYTRKRMLINIGGNDYSFYVIPVSEKDYKDCYMTGRPAASGI